MADDPDPPRKFYQLKPKEFEVVNERVPTSPTPADSPAPDPGPMAADHARIDVRDIFRQANTPGKVLGHNGPVNTANEVHDLLREKHARDVATGQYELGPLDDSKRRRRIRNYWIAIVALNVPLGCFAMLMGPQAAIPFVCAIAGMALGTSYLTWQTFFLRTEY
jgi:hypothetical protein